MDEEIPWESPTPTRRRRLPSKHRDFAETNGPFSSSGEVLDAAVLLFRVRGELAEKVLAPEQSDEENILNIRAKEHQLTMLWHNRVTVTPPSVFLVGLFIKHRLNRLEREIVTSLILDPLGLWPQRIMDVSDVLKVLSLPPRMSLMAMRCLSETAKLCRKELICHDDLDEDLRERHVVADPTIVDAVLNEHSRAPDAFSVRKEEDLREILFRMTRVLKKKSESLEAMNKGYGRQTEFQKWNRKSRLFLGQLDTLCLAHPNWRLSRLRPLFRRDDWTIFLALTGKALGNMEADDDFFRGAGLARTVCTQPDEFISMLKNLMSDAPLLQKGFVQPCGGIGSLLAENTDSVQETEFELTDHAIQALDLEPAEHLAAKRDKSLREAKVRLSDLALPKGTLDGITLALDHVRGADTLMKDWGLATSFTYGRGVTMLFYGPPGTGKTATAEAIAFELGKPLLVADYAEIQNCFVGQTEKNIVSVFRKAQHRGAVLFWDEADAMFFDRDAASRTWEVRDVNVLLQEIERFEGVCILATNRKMTLDKALERRITAKIEFPRPTQQFREAIWKKLIPKNLPLGRDVDFTVLSKTDLAGGEIKNVVLNASRYAFGRCRKGPVTAEDFRKAIEMETEHRWSRSSHRPIGFHQE